MKKLFLFGLLFILAIHAFGDGNLDQEGMIEKTVLIFNRGGGFSLSIESWIGSGVIVSPDGYIVTNRHVAGYYVDDNGVDEYGRKEFKIVGTPPRLIVYQKDWGYGGARLVSVSNDPELDLAVLKIEPLEDLPFATLAYNRNIDPGTTVYAVGHPFGVGWMMTKGVISKDLETPRHHRILVHDASINPGNSGGPLYDEFGLLVGLNYAAFPPFLAENIAVAIAAEDVGEFVKISIEFDQKRIWVMSEEDYQESTWSKKYYTLRLK